MKKVFYKVLSVILCVTMLFSLNCVCFAQAENNIENNYITDENIVIENEDSSEKSPIKAFFEQLKINLFYWFVIFVGIVGGTFGPLIGKLL